MKVRETGDIPIVIDERSRVRVKIAKVMEANYAVG